MKFNKNLVLMGLLLFSQNGFAEPPTVGEVNLERYQGLWHQIAAIPASFQKKCVARTTAEYKILEDGLIEVLNSCDNKDGERITDEGRARVNPDFNNTSKLEVTFVHIFGWIWAFGGDYWVTYLDEDYETVIIGHPDYEYGWILSRNKRLKPNQLKLLHNELLYQGYDTCGFLMSTTDEQRFIEDTPLCNFVKNQSN